MRLKEQQNLANHKNFMDNNIFFILFTEQDR